MRFFEYSDTSSGKRCPARSAQLDAGVRIGLDTVGITATPSTLLRYADLRLGSSWAVT